MPKNLPILSLYIVSSHDLNASSRPAEGLASLLQDEDNDEYVIVNNGFLDIDRELVDDLLLEFPAKLLCKEECKGLCLKCGKNLNFGECDCPKKKEIDPRLAILQKLLENE